MSDLIDREALLRQIDIDSEGEPGYYGDTWKFIDTIKSMPPAELSTNLAEVGTDCISRQAAIDALRDWEMCYDWDEHCREEPKAPWVVSPSGVINKLPSAEPHWIPVTEDTPDEERECWITPKTTSKVYRGVFTRHYGECHRTGFICDDGFMWLNTALAWMYCEVPEPYKGVTNGRD